MKRLIPALAALLLGFALLLPSPAQTPAPRSRLVALDAPATAPATSPATAPTTSPAPTGPALIINDADPAAKKAVAIESVKINAAINGPLAQTTVTLVFRNTLNRVLEGELEFPLPENAAICGYALDVPAGSGILVDGVPIEKLRARQIFESEVRRGIDPGIVEQTRGNNFKTRVHPIPANGTRTIRLTYLSDISSTRDASTFSLPLNFQDPVKSASIWIDIILDRDHPQSLQPSIAGLKDLRFTITEDLRSLRAVQNYADVTLTGALTVTMPAPDGPVARVERRLKPANVENLLHPDAPAPTPEHYFLVSSIPEAQPINAEVPLPQHIAILWDTSLSRATADKTAERAFLEKLLAASPNMTVDLFTTTLHSTPFITSAKHFIITNGNAHALFDYLDNLVYDGALRIDDIFAGANAIISLALSPTPADHIDFYILASDGLVTLGEEKFGDAGSPVYTLCSDPKANHALLKKLAQDSGGMYLNLQRTKPADAAAAVLSPKVVMSISGKPEEVAEIYPRGTVPVTPGQRLNFTGKLLVPEATITIATGIPGALKEQQITLKQAAATDTGLISRFWAQQKIADLSTDPDHNSDALLALGREFNLVTPNTSLIVLETLDQYLRYRIVPPKSRPEIYADFAKRIEQEGQDQKRTEEEKITRVLALWQQRLAWYDVKYDYAKDFKWKQDETAAASSSDARSLDRVQEHLTSQAPPPPTTLPNGTPGGTPPATSQPTPTGGAATTVRVPGYINTNTARNPVLISDTPQRNAAAPAEALDSIDEPSSDLSHNLGSGGAGTSGLLADYRAGKNAPSDTNSSAAITIKPWSPDTPYLKALAAVKPDQAYAAYLEQRKTNLTSPAFYLDCGNFLLENNRRDEGIRVLTNIAQLRLESAPLLRVAAYRLLQINEFDLAIDLFEKAQRLRPDEPQSWRDLALAHAARAAATAAGTSRQGNPAALSDYRRALELYNKVIMNHWDRFDEIELIALMEANALWAEAQRTDIHHELQNPLDPRLLKILDLDVRIVMTWDADNTDIDLHVIEPSGEEAYYSHNRTTIGGLISRDFTQGYGPEEYCLRKAPAGTYKIRANYFGSQQQTLQGPVTVQATVITNFARPDEKRQSLTLRLTDRKENQDIGEVTIDQKK